MLWKLKFALPLFCNAMLACSSANMSSTSPRPPADDLNSKPSLAEQFPKTSIRAVDFANVPYPGYRLPDGRETTLKAGEAAPAHINYGDVTGDGLEEAMVVLPIESRGTAIPHHVYIYGLVEEKLRLLWHFETCDRADGGLRQVYAENGKLVVEVYGRGKRLESNLCADDGTRSEQPYPYAITRSRFTWVNGKFKQEGALEVFSDSKEYGSPIMPRYKEQGG